MGELKYSQAFGRKNEYKVKYFESDKSFISYKKETIETIKKCKEEALTEKNMKLKLIIDNHKKDKFAEELELKVDNLMREYEKLRKSHEEETRILIRNHDNQLKKEKGLTTEASMKVQTLEGERQKAKEYYTRKMKENDRLVNEAEKARLEQIQIVANKENAIRDLKESIRKLEDGKVNDIALIARQKMIEAQKKEIN